MITSIHAVPLILASTTRLAIRFAPQQKLAMHRQFPDYLAGKRIYPINVEISPSGICNATCQFCFYANGDLGGHRKVFLEHDIMCSLLRHCAILDVKSISWTGGGEPSLYPDIGFAVAYAALLKLEQGMFTNALAMPKYDPKYLSWIRVTMTDRPWRKKCIEPLRAAETLGFAFNYSGAQDNEYLKETCGLAEEVGADYVQVRPALKFHGETVDITPPAFNHHLLQVTEYKFEEAKRKHPYRRCEGFHFVPFCWENGDVSVCSYMRKEGDAYILGNLHNQSFKEIMDLAPESVPVVGRCQTCCKNHEINKAVNDARSLLDVNFP